MAAHRHTRDELDLFTEEQLNYLEASRRGAVRAAVRRYRNNALVGFLVLLGGFSYLYIGDQGDRQNAREVRDEQQHTIVQAGRIAAVDGCNRDFEDRQNFRRLLRTLRTATQVAATRGDATPERVKQLTLFYDRQLRTFAAIDCRKAEAIITDDPRDLPNRVEPYFPGNPNNPRG